MPGPGSSSSGPVSWHELMRRHLLAPLLARRDSGVPCEETGGGAVEGRLPGLLSVPPHVQAGAARCHEHNSNNNNNQQPRTLEHNLPPLTTTNNPLPTTQTTKLPNEGRMANSKEQPGGDESGNGIDILRCRISTGIDEATTAMVVNGRRQRQQPEQPGCPHALETHWSSQCRRPWPS
jgi:hypothetical protein